MKSRRAVGLTHCPSCGARIVPTPKELKRWRLNADLNQREMAARLKISAAYLAYLESGRRTPSDCDRALPEIHSALTGAQMNLRHTRACGLSERGTRGFTMKAYFPRVPSASRGGEEPTIFGLILVRS
jgi:transcriptional regulator with XRE-family HTH domain